MDKMWRSNSSVSSKTGCPPNIVNEEDHTVEENEFLYFQKWNVPKVDIKVVYKTSWVENTFQSAYKVRTVEQTFSISKTHEKCCLFSKRNIKDFLAKKFNYLHIGFVQVAVNHSPERVLMFLFLCVYEMLDLKSFLIAFLV